MARYRKIITDSGASGEALHEEEWEYETDTEAEEDATAQLRGLAIMLDRWDDERHVWVPVTEIV